MPLSVCLSLSLHKNDWKQDSLFLVPCFYMCDFCVCVFVFICLGVGVYILQYYVLVPVLVLLCGHLQHCAVGPHMYR